jgi:hypothetical protein
VASAAKYAGESFRLRAGARPLGFGGAYVALAADPSGIYYNPAGLSQATTDQLILLHSETFGSLINHDFVAYSHPVTLGTHGGSLGIGVYRVGGGGILITGWNADSSRIVVKSEKSHYDYLFLAGCGYKVSDRWRAGGTAKIILRSLADNSAWGLGLDLGIQYDVARDLTLGLTVSDITSSFLSYDNGTRESILPSVKVGGSYSLHYQRLTARAIFDGDLLFEGRRSAAQLHSGNLSLDTHWGGELSYENLIFFRAGSDIGRLTFGVGVAVNRFRLDGAYMDHKDLDTSYRLSLNIAL